MKKSIVVTSVSWIDRKNLPTPGIMSLTKALIGGDIGWDDRTVIGLIATSNPTPPITISNVENFRSTHQFRSLVSMKINADLNASEGHPILDAGWTPPFDKAKLPLLARAKSPPKKALIEHEGEKSPLSSVSVGKQVPVSTLIVPPNATVVANMIIKFRAGQATNELGLAEAASPFHVPWVWCETMLVKIGEKVCLLGCGSTFPSHAWYVNGKQVATTLQKMVYAKPNEPAISTGRPNNLPRLKANADKSEGTITGHQYTVSAGEKHSVDLKL